MDIQSISYLVVAAAILLKIFLQKKGVDTKKGGRLTAQIGTIIMSGGLIALAVAFLSHSGQQLYKALFYFTFAGIIVICLGAIYIGLPSKK